MATVQERLNEAEAAYHDWVTGRAVAEIRDQNGETIRYSKTDASRLLLYINGLRQTLAATAGSSGVNPPGGPMRVLC